MATTNGEDKQLFEWRRQQFLRFRQPPDGLTLTEARTRALSSSLRLGELSAETMELVETPPRHDVELELPPRSTGSAHIAPRPRSAPTGLVGKAAAVKLKLHSKEPAVLKIKLYEKDRKHVVSETVKAFRVDPEAWRLVSHSGVAPDGTHLWSFLTTAGVFVAAGLPRDGSVIAGLMASYDLREFFYPLFREGLSFSEAVAALAKTRDWRSLARKAAPGFDEGDSGALKPAFVQFRKHASSLAKVKPTKDGPLQWQILDALSATPDGQRTLAALEEIVYRRSS
jgi:hypothetical protein